MQVCIDSDALSLLLAHATAAARLTGPLDADDTRIAVFGDHVDAVVHGLTKVLGEPRYVTSGGRASHGSALTLAAGVEGAP